MIDADRGREGKLVSVWHSARASPAYRSRRQNVEAFMSTLKIGEIEASPT